MKTISLVVAGLAICAGLLPELIWAQRGRPDSRHGLPTRLESVGTNRRAAAPHQGFAGAEWGPSGGERIARLSVEPTVDSLNVGVVGRWPFGPARAVTVEGNYAYLGSGGGVWVLNVTNPSSPEKVGELATPGTVEGLFISGERLYVADGSAGLRVVDVSNPSNPREVGYYDAPGLEKSVYVLGSFAYVAAYWYGFGCSMFPTPQAQRRWDTAILQAGQWMSTFRAPLPIWLMRGSGEGKVQGFG